jgi:hypothetical protein
LGCKVDVQEVLTVVLEFSPGLIKLYQVWYYQAEAVPFLPFALEVFCELHPEASIEFYSMMQNSHFLCSSENGLTVLPEDPKIQ